MRASNPWDWTPEQLREAEVAFRPRHATGCPLMTCTCGTTTAFHGLVVAIGIRSWREGYAEGRDDEAAGEPVWDRSVNGTGERKAT